MAYETILVSDDQSLRTITLNRPDRLNALVPAMLEELLDAVSAAEAPDSGVRAILMTGAGRGFCAGADLAGDPALMADPNRDMGAMLESAYNPFIQKISDLKIPLVTAVNGPAAGAGMSLAICGDVVFAAQSAYFLQAFVNIGLVPDAGSTYMLPRLVGTAKARAMMMLGEKIPAETAEKWGLVYKCVGDDTLMAEATATARKLAEGATKAISLIRRSVADSWDNSLGDQLVLERELQREAGRTADFNEGVQAFLQKRPARFTGN